MSEDRVPDSVTSPPEFTSGSPGAVLRRCREYHGITLEEASETTKIGISHLKALEDDQIREFANQAYLKGFLRIYPRTKSNCYHWHKLNSRRCC